MTVHTYTLSTDPIEPEQVIDSRDVIKRLEELEDMLSEAEEAGNTLESVDMDELTDLRKLAEDCESCADWQYGESLIRRDYFVRYIEQLIDDCYPMPKEMQSNAWPWCHMTFDLEGAAEAAEADYMEVHYNGHDYLIRNC